MSFIFFLNSRVSSNCLLVESLSLRIRPSNLNIASVCSLVPDAPRNLQLSLNSEEEGVILGHWAPPVHTHGLIREYIVSTVRTLVLVSESFRSLGCVLALWRMAPSGRSLHSSLTVFSHGCEKISWQSNFREKGLLTVLKNTVCDGREFKDLRAEIASPVASTVGKQQWVAVLSSLSPFVQPRNRMC